MNVLRSVFLVCLVFGVSVAQTKTGSKTTTRPDLSGVWAFDKSRSKVDSRLIEEDFVVLTIVHKEPEIRLIKTYERHGRKLTAESVYYTDGRPESHSGVKDSEPETRWRGNKLFRKSVTSPYGGSSGIFTSLETVLTEEFELSADGKTLTRTITHSGAFARKQQYVYTRIS